MATGALIFEDIARRVIDDEVAGLNQLRAEIDHSFAEACKLILGCRGKIVVMGMGKSGHIGSKIAATLASTGTPSFFVHPGEASHGDLGMIESDDMVIAISNSGESGEVIDILPILKRRGIVIIGMSGNPDSSLARYATVHLSFHVEREACPLNLVPTSSTTSTLVLGDALAVALLEARGFTARDFALSHPGGSLGRKLLTTCADVMHSGDECPVVYIDSTIKDAIFEMTSKGLGMVVVIKEDGTIYGIFTDGDLRRAFEKMLDVTTPLRKIIKKGCLTVKKDTLAAETVRIIHARKVNSLVVADDNNRPLGAFNIHDLLNKGVM